MEASVGYFIDIQGTLIDDLDRKPIDGALEFINNLDKPYILVTNNTKVPSSELLNYLRFLGFKCDESNYIDPLMVLHEVLPPQRVAAYGDEKFLNLLESDGYRIDFKNPNAVLIGMKKDFSADEYAQMIELILKGAELVGMHATTIYAKDGKKYPGIGAILNMLSYATNCKYRVVGKPSELFYTKALQKLGCAKFSEVEMISDDLVGDLVGIKKLGAKTTLVLSGKIKDATALIESLKPSQRPDRVIEHIGKMNRWI